jgi:cell division septation protein DedD
VPNIKPRKFLLCAAAFLSFTAPAAAQDVQSGITAWQAGDYAAAVQQWRPLADAGNADAQFNLAQAYRLGRGVAQNLNLAEQWFERAARQRHEQAGASLGLLLFQNGRAREAMPWLQAAAGRGDPRAQYVFGTALFNGDVVRRDLPRAYALMRAAASQGFPQAQQQLGEMESQLSAEDRTRGDALAAEMGSPTPSGAQIAAIDEPPPVSSPPVNIPPSRSGPGVSYEHPPEGGQPVERSRPPRVEPRERPVQVAERPRPRPPVARPPVRTERPAPRPAATGGSWRVQLGAFSNEANARRRWNDLRRRVGALSSLSVAFPRAGNVVRVRAGGFASRDAAARICGSVRAAGGECIPVR